ncbi:MAG: FKBP-type peptidyl-prolyl cis-trans isomerase [Firmicutes bacterium]|nr:FKBP-type peptidyl-prolyl cis-trans isomerase [Bacillota bacterium]
MKKVKVIIALMLIATLITGAFCACGKEENNNVNEQIDFDFGQGLDENGYITCVKASECINVPEYKGIDYPDYVMKVDEDRMQQLIDQMLSQYTFYEKIMDRAVEDGDMVNIDYVGSVDGVEFSGGSTGGKGVTVTIGVTSYIDDFLEQLIGHMPGETVNVEVTFPDEYSNSPELAGKDAVFVTKINYICGDELEDALTEEQQQQLGFKTIGELKQKLREMMIDKQKTDYVSMLLETGEWITFSETAFNYMCDYQKKFYEASAAASGLTLDEYVKANGEADSFEEYMEKNEEEIKKSVLYALTIQAIAEKEGIVITDEQINEWGYSSQAELYGKPYIKMVLMRTKVVPEFIIENAASN